MTNPLPEFGRILDVSALEGAATGKSIYARALIANVLSAGTTTLLIPVTAYVHALSVVPDDLRWQLMLLTTAPVVEIDLLDDREKSHEIADLRSEDVTLGHVAWCGLRHRWPIVTSRGRTLRTVAPELEIDPLP